MSWKMVVTDSKFIPFLGLVAFGEIEGEPAPGPAIITYPFPRVPGGPLKEKPSVAIAVRDGGVVLQEKGMPVGAVIVGS